MTNACVRAGGVTPAGVSVDAKEGENSPHIYPLYFGYAAFSVGPYMKRSDQCQFFRYMHEQRTPLLLSIGTQVVTLADIHDLAGGVRHAGAVGVVVAAPTDAGGEDMVPFADGTAEAIPHEVA